ncbi:serine protease [Enterococcus sp. 3C7_DIV0644]|uniref:S1 family peptidase n=1 Tax=Enterococcus sp. 3C7_DIV0644 TaxID=1834174 RepID=UPI000A3527FE|nr:serine protease [Enterococcus sp. 3C7_DIV0644]OTO24921.1 hypothetical protein A5877_000428 [Enterococcus sp. 3C7_DIV0644]
MDATEKLVSCTVRLQTDISVGTGFYYKMREDENGNFKPVIVTNRHMFEGAERLNIHMRCKSESGIVTCEFPIESLKGSVVFHPNPDIDLAVLPIPGLFKIAQNEMGISPLVTFVSEADIPTDSEIKQLSSIEDVIAVGYPNGLWDQVNIRPLVRRGITATDYKLDYEGKPIFVIDCQIYPGSSGSPIFLYDKGTQFHGNDIVLGGLKVKFLGVNSSVFIHSIEGKIIEKPIPTNYGAITNVPMGLGIIIKACELKEIEPYLPI